MRLSETWIDNAVNCVITPDNQVLPFGMRLFNNLKIDLESALHYPEITRGTEILNLKTNTVSFDNTNCRITTITDDGKPDVLKYYVSLISNLYIVQDCLIHEEPDGLTNFLYCDKCKTGYKILPVVPQDVPLQDINVSPKRTISFAEMVKNTSSKKTRIFLLNDKTYIVPDNFKMTGLKEIDSLDEGNQDLVFDASLRGQNIAIRTAFNSYDICIKPERDYPEAIFDNIQARNLGTACHNCGNFNLIEKSGDIIITLKEEPAFSWVKTVFDIDYAKILKMFAVSIPSKFRVYLGVVIPEDYKDEKCLELAESVVVKMFQDKIPVLYDDREISFQEKRDQAFIHKLLVYKDGRTADESCEKDKFDKI